jgi:hypothetical protein
MALALKTDHFRKGQSRRLDRASITSGLSRYRARRRTAAYSQRPFFDAESRLLRVAISALLDEGQECLKIERLRPPNRHKRTPRR